MTVRPACAPRALLAPAVLAAAALLVLSACHRDAEEPAQAPASPARPAAAPAPVAAPAPAPAATGATAPLTVDERRRKLREEKDGEAQAERAPEYAGASSAATALPGSGDDAPAASTDAPSQASPPPPPSGQPPG